MVQRRMVLAGAAAAVAVTAREGTAHAAGPAGRPYEVYDVSPEMARRCLERCEEARIQGRITILRAVSGSNHAATQGPVWLEIGMTL